MLRTHFDRIIDFYAGRDIYVEKLMTESGLVVGLQKAVRTAASKGATAEQLNELMSAGVLAAIRLTLRKSPTPNSIEGLKRDRDFSVYVDSLKRSPGAELVPVIFACTRALAWFELAGQHVYEVCPGLASMLRDTELRGLQTEDLRLPYPTIYLALPPPPSPDGSGFGFALEHHDGRGEKVDVQGIYITEDIERAEGRAWYIMITGTWPPADGDTHPLQLPAHFFRVVLPLGKSLDEALALSRAEIEADAATGKRFDVAGIWEPIFRWAMNVVVYATYGEAQREEVWFDPAAKALWERGQKVPKGSPKRDRINAELRSKDTRKFVRLGAGIRLDGGPDGTTTPGEAGQKLEVRVKVQGHWRNQAHGPGHSLRKTIWIRPFWKGPDEGVWTATHRLT